MHLIFENSSYKNQVGGIWFLVYFELDFYCLCSLKNSNKISQKSSADYYRSRNLKTISELAKFDFHFSHSRPYPYSLILIEETKWYCNQFMLCWKNSSRRSAKKTLFFYSSTSHSIRLSKKRTRLQQKSSKISIGIRNFFHKLAYNEWKCHEEIRKIGNKYVFQNILSVKISILLHSSICIY